jgi:hypothetical protein
MAVDQELVDAAIEPARTRFPADGDRGYWVLAPCGVCQERLFAYGPDVEVAVPEAADPRRPRLRRSLASIN